MAQLLKLLDGSVLRVKDKDVYESTYSGIIKQVDIEGRRMTMIGTDETKDRDGDIVELNGWRLEDYKKNPVFLWSHNYGSVPLARAEKVIKRREPRALEFQLVYPTKGLHPFADMILELYGEKIINASSVGFIPWDWDEIEQEDEKGQKGKRRPCGRKYKDQELLELSGCAVPSNPNALQNALKAKSFIDMPFEDVQKWLQGQALPPRPKREDDILNELCFREGEVVDETKPKQVQVPLTFCEVVDETKEPKEETKPPEEETKPEEKETECPTWDGKVEGLEVPPYDDKDAVRLEDVTKPYPNEHACRLEDPGKFSRFARKNCYRKHDGKCVDFIFGFGSDGGGKVQAMRYGKEIWTASAARAHCSSHKGSFEAASSESSSIGNLEMELIGTMFTGLEVRMTDLFKELKDQLVVLTDAVKTLKPTGTDLANKPKDQVPDGGEKKGKSASEAILEEAFKLDGGKTNLPPKPPVQYDFSGVKTALKDLETQLKRLGGN